MIVSDQRITDHVLEPYQFGPTLVICIYLYGDPPKDPCGRYDYEHARIKDEHAPAEEVAGA